MSDTAEQLPADPPPEDDTTIREDMRSQFQAWGEELKQEITSRIDQALDQLGARLQSFGS